MTHEALKIARLGTTSFFKRVNKRVTYKGPVKACVLDWSGTTADAHVLAPAVVFVKVFEKHGVPITMQEAREPMGLRKDLHIGKILEMPEVQARWAKVKGKSPNPDPEGSDVKIMFGDFVPMQLECLKDYTTLLPGTVEAVKYLRTKYGIKFGSSTGFTKVMVDILRNGAEEQGMTLDTAVGGDEVPNNMGFRPTPFMIYQNLNNLKIWPVQSVVKVDDTVTGVGEGLNAGSWSVGVAAYSNYTDVNSLEEWDDMEEGEKEKRRVQSREKLLDSGAHYVIDSIAQLPLVVEEINERMSHGDQP